VYRGRKNKTPEIVNTLPTGVRAHIVRHFPAIKNKKIEEVLGATEGAKLRPLDTFKVAKLAPIFRAKLAAENPHFALLGNSPTVRTAATMLIATVDIADAECPTVEIQELYWTDESIAGIMPDFTAHGINTSKWSHAGLEALDLLGKTGASGIVQAITELRVTKGDVLFVGHAPLTISTAYHLAGNTSEAREFCLSCTAGEGSRFVIENGKVSFVPLE